MVQTQAIWSKTKTGGKIGFDKVYGWVDKLGPPVNRLSNKLGSEAFWPTTLDIESDKASRILQSFCKDGFYTEEAQPSTNGPQAKQRVLKRIPAEVIKNAKGLAIFTTMRTGLWFSGAGGSGVLVGRQADGTWSPPSGILLHTAGLGFLVGVDIYDCVVVINTQKALDAFSSVRCTLGGEISAVAGPVGIGGVLETELHKRQAPVFNYLKSRGFYAGVQIDGTIIIERTDENERFYGEKIAVKDILAGKARSPPREIRRLIETIKSAQGDVSIDQSLLPTEPPPADFEIENEHQVFGVPDKEDPDPFGVLELEQAGLEIKEAGTNRRPASEQFEFRPAPTSPIYNTFRNSIDRSSVDARSRRSSWRASTISSVLGSRPSSTKVDSETQTDPHDSPPSTPKSSKFPQNQFQNTSPTMSKIPEDFAPEDKCKDERKLGLTDSEDNTARHSKNFDDVDLDADDSDDEEPIIEEFHQAPARHDLQARIVTVAKPTPPKLPPRNPFRSPRSVDSDSSTAKSARDAASVPSPKAVASSSMTPSLKNDGSSASSQESISSIEGLDLVSKSLEPKLSPEAADKEECHDSHSISDSPVKPIPGGFI